MTTARSRFLKVVDVHVDQLGQYPDLAHDLSSGAIDVSIVRGVFAPEVMSAVRERMERDDYGLRVSPQQDPDLQVEQVVIFGDAITPCNVEKGGPPAQRYHASAVGFRNGCTRLFEGLPDYETRIREVFRRVAGGREVDVPRDDAGRIYTPSTIRRVPPGREINVHVGNYFLSTPAYAFLGTLFAPVDQLSFFVPISPASEGGALEVFDLTFQDPRTPMQESGDVDDAAVRAGFPFESFTPGAGDMFLFNGGRYYHRVDHVRGGRPRWTIGGFISFSKNREVLYYWG